MKTLIPSDLKGKSLFSYLVANKKALIAEKKSMLKQADPFSHSTAFINIKTGLAVKAATADDETQEGEGGDGEMDLTGDTLRVKVVANSANWVDSQKDMLLRDSGKKSIKERSNMIPHLHDHIHQIGAKVGEVVSIKLVDMSLKDLGLNQAGTTQCVVFETDIIKSYNPQVFNQYKLKKINQHSIGLLYINIELAINDEDCEKEMDFWNKYAPLAINQDALADGYFWVVSEYKLMENSAVLFGSNILTPTLETSDTPTTTPPSGTGKSEPSTTKFNILEAINKTTFIKN